MAQCYNWTFPLPRVHTGMLLGNGVLGAMVWGEDSTLCITLGRADLWDHRGGLDWSRKQTYAAIRDCLERSDNTGLRALFENTGNPPGQPARPSILPIGRIELDFGHGAKLVRGTLDLEHGSATVIVRRHGLEYTVRLVLDMARPVVGISLPAGLDMTVHRVPAWEYVGDYLASICFAEPAMFDDATLSGWTQTLPADPALCVAWQQSRRGILVGAVRGADADAARANAHAALAATSLGEIRRSARSWWKRYWETVPTLDIPNENLRFLHDYGMYKFAGLTHPDGIAATLQGPWVEDYQMPPWSNDYHFNINVQMCYWPAYHGNCLAHLKPLWELIRGWLPLLRRNARYFLGIDDGYMLPHAVDDRCTCMGGFWTGTVDHGCTAWVAQMMFRYYRYTRDEAFLRELAFPFMKGAMRVYEAMLERNGDGFVLPVSVSPEYRGAAMNAWGANASFQLACIHRLTEDLLAAAELVGEVPAPIWREIRERCPKACLIEQHGKPVIALWQNTPLEESHRHHSHLAGITPFDSLDLDDPEWRPVIDRSIVQWIHRGPGLWSGWCVPWASMIHTRLGNADAAELWLEIWQKVYTNEGHGTLHDVDFAGFSLMGKGASASGTTRGEIMQMDAGMGATAAIQEMLLHVRRGVTWLFRGAPLAWERCGFRGMCTEGGFLLSASRRDGDVGKVTIESPHGGTLLLANPWDRPARLRRPDGSSETLVGDVLAIVTQPGETVSLSG